MGDAISILGFAGSLRKNSYNKALLKVAMESLPENVKLELFDFQEIPPFNQDLENRMPKIVKELKAKIRNANALLIATPEYNYSFSGVLRNAIDWASRPYGDNPFEGKPVAIMSASTGMLGGSRAQYHLRQVFVTLNIRPVNKPEVIVCFADEKIDENGNVVDEATRKKIKQLIESIVELVKKLRC